MGSSHGPAGVAGRKPRTATDLLDAATGPLPKGLTGWMARVADRASNRADRVDLPFNLSLANAFPDRLFIADLHADTLLWGVDPWARRDGGQLDLPRLIEARLGLQVFGGPTWTPLPMKNSEQALCVSCESIDQSDALFPSQLLDRVRRGKGVLRRQRAHKLAARFQEMLTDDRDEILRPVYRAEDLEDLWDGVGPPSRRAPIGVMLSLEGLHWIEPDADPDEADREVESLARAGFRMIAPTHRFSNGLGGASEDCQGRIGLTEAGRAVLNACFRRGIAVDLAHGSPAMIREAAGLALNHPGKAKPLLVSHAGVRAAHRVARNLRDADIRAVASTGGVIGIGVWEEAVGYALSDPYEHKVARIVDAFRAALSALSEHEFAEEMEGRFGRYDPYAHLAIGSDFDGAVHTPFDVTGLSHLLAALLSAENADGAPLVPRDKLPLIAGENARRTLA
ncbi:MAG: membrane dipeptidase, partial [Pseudomonadota bacterium]